MTDTERLYRVVAVMVLTVPAFIMDGLAPLLVPLNLVTAFLFGVAMGLIAIVAGSAVGHEVYHRRHEQD